MDITAQYKDEKRRELFLYFNWKSFENLVI